MKENVLSGRRVDKNGNGVTSWTQPMIDMYEKRAQCFVDQFNNYTLYYEGEKAIPVNYVIALIHYFSMRYNHK